MDKVKTKSDQRFVLPSFLGLGSQRCASTWLYSVLSKHPDVVLTYDKETHFLSHRISEQPLDWYAHFFLQDEKGNKRKLLPHHRLGEIDPHYAVIRREEIELIHQIMPELKLILIIRNPVDRLVSSITRGWSYAYLAGEKKKNANVFHLLRLVDKPISVRFTDYETIYRNWSEVYGSSNILLDTYDNVKENPTGFMERVLTFLDLDKESGGVLETVIRIKKNVSKPEEKEDIPPMLYWYLSRKWLPKVIECQKNLDVDLTSWIEDMQAKVKAVNSRYYFIAFIHYIYYIIPCYFAYRIVKFFQLTIKIRNTKRFIASQLRDTKAIKSQQL